ncbi:hypothetical protein TWF730_002647 [Orbilia blumenaviensis]
MFMIGRFTLGFFSTLACRSSSIYLIEISPADRRGTIAGLYNTLFFLGSILATLAVLVSESLYHGHAAWRVPVALQCVFPAIVASGVRYIPESPRWLVANSRSAEARDVMASLHANGVVTRKVSEEFTQMEADVKQRDGMPTGWSILYSTPARKRRLFILLCMSLFGQMSGNNIISYYLPSMLHDVGIQQMSTKLYLNGLYAIIGWTAAAVGARLHDHYGRRKMYAVLSKRGFAIIADQIQALQLHFRTCYLYGASRSIYGHVLPNWRIYIFDIFSYNNLYLWGYLCNRLYKHAASLPRRSDDQ